MPAQITLGNAGFRLLSESPDFDPELGYGLLQIYEGSEQSCKANVAALGASNNWRARAYQYEGPIWRLEVRVPARTPKTSDVETIRFTFETEFAQVDMRSHPNVIEATTDAVTLNSIIEEADKAIRGETTFSGTTPIELELYALRSYAQKSFEVSRLALRREVSFPIEQFALGGAKYELDTFPKIYTTAALIRVFGLPAGVADALPDDPTYTPAYHRWAWKKRRDSSDILPDVGKVHAVTEWVFAAWPTLTYELVT